MRRQSRLHYDSLSRVVDARSAATHTTTVENDLNEE